MRTSWVLGLYRRERFLKYSGSSHSWALRDSLLPVKIVIFKWFPNSRKGLGNVWGNLCMYVYMYIYIYLNDLLKQYCPGWFQNLGFIDPLPPASLGVALWATSA